MTSPSQRRDPLNRFLAMPARIVWSDPAAGAIENPDALLRDDLTVCRLAAGDGPGPSITLDFGREYNGSVRIAVPASTPRMHVPLRIRFGESVSETFADPNNDHAIHDFTVDFPGMGTQEFGLTGFRFVRIDLLEPNTAVTIRSVQAVAIERDRQFLGSFESSDQRLNEIYRVGARTVHLCCQDIVMDGIKRDRLAWMGDLHPQLHVIAALFGPHEVVPHTLDFLRDTTDPDAWINNIPSYSLWWIVSHWDWYMLTADLPYLRAQRDALTHLTKRLANHIDPDGRQTLGSFVDHALLGDPTAEGESIQAIFVLAADAAAKIARAINDDQLADLASQLHQKLRAAPLAESPRKHVHAVRAIAGLEDPRHANQICLALQPDRQLSTWFGYYVLQARALADDHAGCLDLIRSYWGGMLDLGATTFFEAFETEWLENAGRMDEIVPPDKRDVHGYCGKGCYEGQRHSLCHGWAAGPTAWLPREVLGIVPLEPGYRKAAVRPHLADLTFAAGTLPTPHGPITVEHSRRPDGAVASKIDAPPKVELV